MAESVFEASQWDSLYPYQQEKLHREILITLTGTRNPGSMCMTNVRNAEAMTLVSLKAVFRIPGSRWFGATSAVNES